MVTENLGGVYYRQGRYAQTIELLQGVLAVRRKMLGDNHTAVARTIHNMARSTPAPRTMPRRREPTRSPSRASRRH
jgi:hypothetical protein